MKSDESPGNYVRKVFRTIRERGSAPSGLVRRQARRDAVKIRQLEGALDRANALIGQQADEMKALSDEIDTLKTRI